MAITQLSPGVAVTETDLTNCYKYWKRYHEIS